MKSFQTVTMALIITTSINAGIIKLEEAGVAATQTPSSETVKENKCMITASDVEGPYYLHGAPEKVGVVCESTPAHDQVFLSGRIQTNDCSLGLPSTIHLWQTNMQGKYSREDSFGCRSIIRTDEHGNYNFTTLMPGRYDDAGFRPGHIHWKVFPDDTRYHGITTQLYFLKDKYLGDNDSCKQCGSHEESLQVLVTHTDDIKTFTGEFNVTLQLESDFQASVAANTAATVNPSAGAFLKGGLKGLNAKGTEKEESSDEEWDSYV